MHLLRALTPTSEKLKDIPRILVEIISTAILRIIRFGSPIDEETISEWFKMALKETQYRGEEVPTNLLIMKRLGIILEFSQLSKVDQSAVIYFFNNQKTKGVIRKIVKNIILP